MSWQVDRPMSCLTDPENETEPLEHQWKHLFRKQAGVCSGVNLDAVEAGEQRAGGEWETST